MKKENINSKIYFILFITFLFIMVLCTLYELNLFELIKQYYSNNIKEEPLCLFLKEKISENNYGFDYIIIWGTNIFQCVIPFFGIISIYLFHDTLKNFDLKKTFTIAFKLSIVVFCAYLMYYLSIMYLFDGITNSNISGELFIDIFGKNFYYNNIYFYYMLEGLIRFLFVPFIYIAFGIILNQIISKKIICSYLLIIYYYGNSLLALTIKEFVGNIAIYFNPSTIAYSNIYENINTIFLLFTNLFPLFFSLFLYFFKNKKVSAIVNVFNNKSVYILLNFLILSLLCILLSLINENPYDTIVTLYNNIGFFLIYLYFSYLLNDDIDFNLKTTTFLKKIIVINFLFCTLLFMIYYTIMKFIYQSFDVKCLVYLSCNLFLILMIIYFIQYSISENNIKKYWFLTCLFSFIYMIKYIYMNDFLFINLFKYYFISNDVFHFHLIHYIIWILIPIFVILGKTMKKDS